MEKITSSYPQEIKDLGFVFIDNKERFNEYSHLIEDSQVEGEVETTGYYFIYEGYPITLFKEGEKYYVDISWFLKLQNEGIIDDPFALAEEVEEKIDEGLITVHYGKYMKYFTFGPPKTLRHSYISFMIYEPDQQIIGYYYGKLKKGCSTSSYIQIREDFTGKGYCKLLAGFSYCSLLERGIKCIDLLVTAQNPASACRCYIEAGETCGFKIYWEEKKIGKNFCSTPEFLEYPILKLLYV